MNFLYLEVMVRVLVVFKRLQKGEIHSAQCVSGLSSIDFFRYEKLNLTTVT